MLTRNLLSCSLGLFLLAPAAGWAQTATPPAQALSPEITAAIAKIPKPKSKQEVQAVQALQKLVADQATTPAQMDAALTDFVTKFPNSEYLGTVATYGLRFYQTEPHKDYEKSLLYGEQAIEHDPASVYALATVGDVIAKHVEPTDLDHDQRVAEATKDDHQAIAVASSGVDKINGVPFPEGAKNLTQAIAYNSLATLATKAKDYPAAVANYEQAAKFDGPPASATDYFYMARAQIQLKQYPQALASLQKALDAAPGNAAVQNAVDSNRKLIAQLEKSGQK